MNRNIALALVAFASVCFGTAVASACPSITNNGRSMTLNPNMSDCAYGGQRAGHNGSNGLYFIGLALQQQRAAQARHRFEMQQHSQFRRRTVVRQTHRVVRTSAVSPRSHYAAPRGPIAQPTGQTYSGPQVAAVENGIKYTGKSCRRADGSEGREGFGVTGGLGCWRF